MLIAIRNRAFASLWRQISIISRTRFTREFRVFARRILTALLIVFIIIIIEGLVFWYLAKGTDSAISTPLDGIYYVLVSIMGVGETSGPTSIGARIVTLVALIEGLIFATYLIAISAFFTIRGGRVMDRSHINHVIVCGWNFQAPLIIRELLTASETHHFDVVVLPGKDVPEPLSWFGNKVFVVLGSPADDKTLIKANIDEAKSVIVLSDTALDANNADAWSLMITLAVETMNPSVYSCVQLMNSENAIHLRRANVDEIVPFDVLGASLSVASALYPGVSKVVSELVHFDAGSEIYRLDPPIPSDVIGVTFKEAALWFIDRDMILVAIESDDLSDSHIKHVSRADRSVATTDRGVYVNPINHHIKDNDALFVIAVDDPKAMLS